MEQVALFKGYILEFIAFFVAAIIVLAAFLVRECIWMKKNAKHAVSPEEANKHSTQTFMWVCVFLFIWVAAILTCTLYVTGGRWFEYALIAASSVGGVCLSIALLKKKF